MIILKQVSPMQKIKVVSPLEMNRIERVAFQEGSKSEDFMNLAGEGIADKVSSLTDSQKIVLLSGKGNNAGDGFTSALFLLKKNYKVRALLFFDPKEFSDLCLKKFVEFKKAGGTFSKLSEEDLSFENEEIVIDAVFGIGLKGKIDPFFSSIFTKINSFNNLKISIDVPSGLDGETGIVSQSAIKADHTIYLTFPKRGFFLNDGWDFVGLLHRVSFGLEKKYIDEAKADFFLIEEQDIKDDLPPIERKRDKYQAGFVAACAGSLGMEGAANLSGKAALRIGAGIVKLFIYGFDPKRNEKSFDELVKFELDLSKKEEILNICNSASSVFIGPGIGRKSAISDLLQFLLPKINKPLVLDADGLYFFSNNLDCKLPKEIILTPHRGEMLRLLKQTPSCDEELFSLTQNFCENHSCVIVLKGAPTFIFKPQDKPTIVLVGDPGMATAGSGDVLTGIIAGLLSQKMDIYKAAVLGVYLHGRAGEIASKEKTSYSMIASDIIECLPKVLKKN